MRLLPHELCLLTLSGTDEDSDDPEMVDYAIRYLEHFTGEKFGSDYDRWRTLFDTADDEYVRACYETPQLAAWRFVNADNVTSHSCLNLASLEDFNYELREQIKTAAVADTWSVDLRPVPPIETSHGDIIDQDKIYPFAKLKINITAEESDRLAIEDLGHTAIISIPHCLRRKVAKLFREKICQPPSECVAEAYFSDSTGMCEEGFLSLWDWRIKNETISAIR